MHVLLAALVVASAVAVAAINDLKIQIETILKKYFYSKLFLLYVHKLKILQYFLLIFTFAV